MLPRGVALCIGVLIVNVSLALYLGYLLLNQTSEPFRRDTKHTDHDEFMTGQVTDPIVHVEIWSKAAIGQYVWQSILKQHTVNAIDSDLYVEGTARHQNVQFKFRSGPSLKLSSFLDFPVENVVLILNFRDQEKVNYSLSWIETIAKKSEIKNVGIIALGSEQCNNKWTLNYVNHSQFKIRFMFIVYDWNKVDNVKIFQWPLGVATYRNFPVNVLSSLNLSSARPYLCNFIATVYPNSSRQELSLLFEQSIPLSEKCLVKTRQHWEPNESDQSMAFYVEALEHSDLTLSPIGMNHECYRILEAVEYASVPVIELNPKHLSKGSCDRSAALRLFRQYNAPFIYVHNWTLELPAILQRQSALSLADKTRQRTQLSKWYHRFKKRVLNHLIQTINLNFIKKKHTIQNKSN